MRQRVWRRKEREGKVKETSYPWLAAGGKENESERGQRSRGRNVGRLHTVHLTRVAGETKGNVQGLKLWDTLPNCLGGQNQCHLLNHFIQDFF